MFFKPYPLISMRSFPEQEANAVIQIPGLYAHIFLSAKADGKDPSFNKKLIIEVIF